MSTKRISRALLIASTLILCVSTTPIAGASVKAPAKAGRTITDPLNTIRSGKGAPSSSLGINGDFYIDLATNDYTDCSNTFVMDIYNNWNGICIEPNPRYLIGMIQFNCFLLI